MERLRNGPANALIGNRIVSGAWTGFKTPPRYSATVADRRTIQVAGLDLPVRATVAAALVTLALLLDYSRTFVPEAWTALGRSPDGMLAIALERVVLFGLIPLAVVLLGFRDRPARYGLTLGDWRWGAGLTIAGCVVMTPIVVMFAALPDVRALYAPSAGPLGQLVLSNVLDLTATEFAYRGFLLFTLVRLIGPFGLVVAAMPFVFAHLGKPELELFSTLGGGMVYGWLAWRTGSIVWGSIGHVYVLTLVTAVAAGG